MGILSWFYYDMFTGTSHITHKKLSVFYPHTKKQTKTIQKATATKNNGILQKIAKCISGI